MLSNLKATLIKALKPNYFLKLEALEKNVIKMLFLINPLNIL